MDSNIVSYNKKKLIIFEELIEVIRNYQLRNLFYE